MRETGRCVRWAGTFGFVAPDAGGTDVFVHYRALDDGDGYRELEPGQRVTFERGADPSGRPCARLVRHA